MLAQNIAHADWVINLCLCRNPCICSRPRCNGCSCMVPNSSLWCDPCRINTRFYELPFPTVHPPF
ncbi:hypothetical protein SLEP1_g31437 [Rubroshorea leprosula]|uniref:Uncharacterized protein n=1 Tax=Rubroshorea leprosula TaxID=152421 RepID=A0AAV5K3D2_9ROSI|nr:hypothetical protein SLEP1_g31437 [Rubroshorea leprosula]